VQVASRSKKLATLQTDRNESALVFSEEERVLTLYHVLFLDLHLLGLSEGRRNRNSGGNLFRVYVVIHRPSAAFLP
jgi:hypothetical protein